MSEDEQHEYEGQFEEQEAAPPAPLAAPPPQSAIQLAPSNETAMVAAAAYEARMIEARFVIAERKPRSLMKFRQALLARCASSEFAEIAIYAVPRGKKKNPETGRWEPNIVRNVSIRFAEEALRNYPNLDVKWTTIYEDGAKRICRGTIMDFESASSETIDVTIPKTVERSKLGKGQRPLGKRVNSYGEDVYIVEATAAEVDTNEGAMRARCKRNQIVAMLPGEIVAEAKAAIFETRRSEVRKDPKKSLRSLADAFLAVGVNAEMLADYMEKPLDAFTEDDIVDLRGVFAAIKAKEVRWADAVAARHGSDGPEAKTEDPEVASKLEETRKKVAAARERAEKTAAEKAGKKGGAAPPPPEPKPTPKPEASPATEAATKPVPGVDEPPADWKPSGG